MKTKTKTPAKKATKAKAPAKKATKAKTKTPAKKATKPVADAQTLGRAFLADPAMRLSHLTLAVHGIKTATEQAAKTLGAVDIAQHYVAVKTAAEALEELSSALNSVKNSLKSQTVPETFEREGVGSLTLDTLGLRVGVSSLFRASLNPDARLTVEGVEYVGKEAGYWWLRSNGLGDLVTETVNASTLSAAMSKRVEDGLDAPEDIIKTAIIPSTSVTKIGNK